MNVMHTIIIFFESLAALRMPFCNFAKPSFEFYGEVPRGHNQWESCWIEVNNGTEINISERIFLLTRASSVRGVRH